MITVLDVDTWEEVGTRPRKGSGMSKCYLTFDAQFKWTDDATDFVPLMSGGLLAMSKTWWDELSGLDHEMRGWGGENIDQSLRIWRCGGEIVSAPESYVAHMWRDASKPKTLARYHVMPGSADLNIARAARAHFGESFFSKTLQFDPFRRFVNKEPNSTAIERPMLTCRNGSPAKSFEWYLKRFRYIYRDAGVLPEEIFQIELQGTGLCLDLAGGSRKWGSALAPESFVSLKPCATSVERNSGQWWHASNRDSVGRCCSGLKAWNTDQCLSRSGGKVATRVCILGGTPEQSFSLDARGLRAGGRDRCVVEDAASLVIRGCYGAPSWVRRNRRHPREFNALSVPLQAKWVQRDATPVEHVPEL